MHGEQDHVVQEPHRLRVVPAHHVVDKAHELRRAEHLGGVQAAVDPHDRLALGRERVGLIVGQTFRVCEPLRRFLVAREVLQIVRGGDDRHQLGTALGRVPDGVQHHAGGLPRELLPVCEQLGVGRQLVIGAEVEAQGFLGRGNAALGQDRCGGRNDRERQYADGTGAKV